VEDIDLGHRLAAAGGHLQLDPSIQGTHLKRWTLRSMLWTDFARRGAPWVALQLRTRSISASLNCSWKHRISALLCTLTPLALLVQLPLVALAAATSVVGLNRAFYALLLRQLGVAQAAIAIVLHGLHHLVSVAAVPAGIAMALAATATTRHATPRREAALEPLS
jgi:hypothetical protein